MTFGFVCGLVEFVMGLLNLGLLVKFVSQPVISAFSTAVAFQVPPIRTNIVVSKYLFFLFENVKFVVSMLIGSLARLSFYYYLFLQFYMNIFIPGLIPP